MLTRNRLPRYFLLAIGPAMLAGFLLARVQDNPPGRPAAPTPAKAPLTELSIDLIMKGEDLVGTAPSDPVWATDAKTLYFRWKKPGTDRSELFAVTVANPLPRLVKSEELLKLPPLRSPAGRSSRLFGFGCMGGEMALDKARKRGLVNQNGDLFLIDLATGKSRQLTATDEREAGARFTADEQGVVFSLADNLFLMSLVDGTIRQLTSFTKKAPPAEKKSDEIEKWYADQPGPVQGAPARRDEGRPWRAAPPAQPAPATKALRP